MTDKKEAVNKTIASTMLELIVISGADCIYTVFDRA